MAAFYTDLTVSLANQVRFIQEDGLLPSMNNTLTRNEAFNGVKIKDYCQKWINGETLYIQVKASGDETSGIECVMTKYENGAPTVISYAERTVYSTFNVYDFTISLSTGDDFYLQCTTDTDTWTSENIIVESELSGYLKIEWFNYDPMVANANFEFDYSTTTAQANANKLYIKANNYKYSAGGESEVFDNQNEKIKLKQNVFRKLAFESDEVPIWMAEKILIASAHDVFVVNDVAYTVEDLIDTEPSGKTNFVTIKAELTQSTIKGLNTHDIGFDNTDAMAIENKVETNATVSGSFSVSAGYGITQIVAVENETDGDVTLKVGTSIGGEEIMYETDVPISSADWLVVNTRFIDNTTSAWTIYYTISGASPDIYLSIQTLPFTQ